MTEAPIPFSVRPGKAGPWRSVQAMLRVQHDAAREAVDRAIAERKAKGVPTDDLVDWRADITAALALVGKTNDRDEIVAHLERAHAIANGGLRPIPAYVDDVSVEGVLVRLRALSKADVMEMRADLAAVPKADDAAGMWRSSAATHRALRPFLAKCLVGVSGVALGEDLDGRTLVDGLTADDARMAGVLDDLDTAGLLGAVFSCARAYQDLNPFQRAGFGSLPPSTSARTSAAVVLPLDESTSGVTATPRSAEGSTSEASQTSALTAASVATSSTMTLAEGLSVPRSTFTDG